MLAPEGLRFDDLQMQQGYQAFACYGHSKLANILFNQELARRLEGSGVTANAVHPGYVKTELGRWRPEDKASFTTSAPARGKSKGGPDLSSLPDPVSVEEGASTSIYLATSPEVEGVSGGYYTDSKPHELKPNASDPSAAAKLWEISEALLAET